MKNNFVFRIEKEKAYLSSERFNQTLNKYIPYDNKVRKNVNLEDFAERKASISTAKFGKSLENITTWKIFRSYFVVIVIR